MRKNTKVHLSRADGLDIFLHLELVHYNLHACGPVFFLQGLSTALILTNGLVVWEFLTKHTILLIKVKIVNDVMEQVKSSSRCI